MSFAEDLKRQLNIVDVVSQYVRLKRQAGGSRYVGLCPFHSEKTPSFGVNANLGFFKCFGCDAGGDVFTFIQQIESLTFPETLRLLADRYGIAMPDEQKAATPEEQTKAAIYEMHEIAADLFQSNLRGVAGADSRKYLESRNVSKPTMDEFRLGLAIDSWDQLAKRLQKFDPAILAVSGLVKPREGGGFYDIFRDRIIFPIHDENGKLVGFGGRARSNDAPQRYLNSPETPIYKKSAVLYNMHRAKADARKNDRMILVEGYMDVIGIYSAGIREVVAISGTAMAAAQVKALKRQVSHQQASGGQVFFNLDSDEAGAKSTEKHIGTLLSEGLRVRVLEIPGGLDPDEFIHQRGVEAYRKLLGTAASYFHWMADRARSLFDMKTAEGRMDAYRYLEPSIQQITDSLERSMVARDIAALLDVDMRLMQSRLAKNLIGSKPAGVKIFDKTPLPTNERLLLESLLISADARAAVRHYVTYSKSLPVLETADIFNAVISLNEPFSIDRVLSNLGEDRQKVLTSIAMQDSSISEESAINQALHCLKALEAKEASLRTQNLKKAIKEMEESGDIEGAARLLGEMRKLKTRVAD